MSVRAKAFKIRGDQIRQVIPPMGSCYASERITVDGAPVGYMYREQPKNEYDSGWHFFAGDEPQEYSDDPEHFAIYDVNTICNYDPAIVPLLDAPLDSAFARVEGTNRFEPEALERPDDEQA